MVFARTSDLAGNDAADDYSCAQADADAVGGLFVARLHRLGHDLEWMTRPTCWSARPRGAKQRLAVLRDGHAERPPRERIEGTTSTSFACDLKKWLQIMEAYEGGARLDATMPTDGLVTLHHVMRETRPTASTKVKAEQVELGAGVRVARGARLPRSCRGLLGGRGGELHRRRRHP